MNCELASEQFGFRSKLSTIVALAHFSEEILVNLDNKKITGAVSVDLRKAFHTVDHAHTKKIDWILYIPLFLHGLHHIYRIALQVTTINNLMPTPKPVTVVVPQGSILGSSLLNLH